MAIQELSKSVEYSLLTSAPEKWAELVQAFKDCPFKFEWPNTPNKLPNVNPSTGVISIPLPGSELIWASSFLYWVLYNEHCLDQKSGSETFDLLKNRRRTEALLLYYWARTHYLSGSRGRIADLPAPTLIPEDNSDVHMANEVFLSAISWILHHEVAHLRCGHTSIPVDSRAEEKQADQQATMWLLDSVPDEAMKTKRVLGLSVAILVLTALDIESGVYNDLTHPKSFIRLEYCLNEANLSDDHLAYAFSVAIMRVHMRMAGLSVPSETSTTFKDQFYEVLAAIVDSESR